MIANRHGAKMRRLRLPLLSLLPRTLLSLLLGAETLAPPGLFKGCRQSMPVLS
jgi:hypothetical protein